MTAPTSRPAILRAAALILFPLLTACRSSAPPPPSPAASATASAAPSATASAAPAEPPASDTTSASASPASAADVTALAWQPRGARLAVARGPVITLLDPRHPDDPVRLAPLPAPVAAVTWSDDGALVAAQLGDGTLHLLATADNAAERTLTTDAPNLHAVAFSHDGRLVAAAYEDAHFHASTTVWDTRTGAPLPVAGPASEIGSYWRLAFLGDNHEIAAFDAVAVTVWDVRTGKRTGGRAFETGATSPLTLSPDGTFAAVALEQHALVAWPLGTDREVHLDGAHGCEDHLGGLHFAADAHTLTMRSASGRWGSWRVPSLAPRSTWKPTRPLDEEVGVMSDDGAFVVLIHADGSSILLDAFTGRKARTIEGSMPMDVDLAFSADGRWFAQAGPAPAVWEIATGRRTAL